MLHDFTRRIAAARKGLGRWNSDKGRSRRGRTGWLGIEPLEPRALLTVPASITNLVVSEVYYNPYPPQAEEAAGLTAGDFEFVELKNVGSDSVSFDGVKFIEVDVGGTPVGITYIFPNGIQLGVGQYIVVASNLSAFQGRYGTGINVVGPFTGALGNNGELLTLRDQANQSIATFAYNDSASWPQRADGDGASLELDDLAAVPKTDAARTGYLEDGKNWHSSSELGGSPGRAEAPDAQVADIVVTEILAHTDEPQVDSIELYNKGLQPINLGYWWLSDTSTDYTKFQIPPDTLIQPGQYLVFHQGHWDNHELKFAANEFGNEANGGFGLSAADGEDVWLMKGNAAGKPTHFSDRSTFGPSLNGVSFGMWPLRTDPKYGSLHRLYPMASVTLGSDNRGPRVGDVIISELQYNPGSGQGDLEFIELFNTTNKKINLNHWRLDGGVYLEFGNNTEIAARSTLLVVPFDPDDGVKMAAFRLRYPNIPPTVVIVGGYNDLNISPSPSGLANNGELVQLRSYDLPPLGEPNYYPSVLEDEVDYDDGQDDPDWPTAAAGGGASLHRQRTYMWGDHPASWLAAQPSPGVVPNFDPFAADDTAKVRQNVAEPILVLSNDRFFGTSPNPSTVQVVAGKGPAHGTAIPSQQYPGTIDYTPNQGYAGEDSFWYTVSDDQGHISNQALVTIRVKAPNHAPVAVADTYGVAVGGTLEQLTGRGVLANDTDQDEDPLHALLVSGPTHGDTTFNGNGLQFDDDGLFMYRPAPGYQGLDTFQYKATDGYDESAVVTVTIRIGAVNQAPVLDPNGDARLAAINEDVASGANSGTLVTDIIASVAPLDMITDADAGAVEGIAVTAVGNGNGTWQYRVGAGGAWTAFGAVSQTAARLLAADDATWVRFVPNANFNGTVSPGITFRAWDQTSGTAGQTADVSTAGGTTAFSAAAETASIVVNPVNDPPVAANDSYSVNEDGVLTVNAPGVLANDSDVDGNPLSAVRVAGPAHGTLTLNANGSFEYRPQLNYNGPDSFTYKANDGQANSNVATVSITVNSVNDPPVAANDSYSVNEDGVLTVAAPGVLANDSDVDGNPLSAVWVAGPAHGTLTLNANGSFEYRPQLNYNGPDSFTYKANDGQADSNVATVSITVNSANDPPVAANDSYSVNEDGVLTVNSAGILANDSDADGDPLSAIRVTGPAHGSLTLNADGSFAYQPALNYNGSDSFTYKANDGQADSNVATVTITINPVNDAPVAVDDTYSVDVGGFLSVSGAGVLANDSDVDGDPLTALRAIAPAHGLLILRANGSLVYVPDAGYRGMDSFTYKANDGKTDSNVATVTINVGVTNAAPVLDPSGDAKLGSIDEDVLASANAGTLVRDIIASVLPLDMITDADFGAAEGIAVIGLDSSHGTWQYRIGSGGAWTAFGAVSQTSARLLAADDSTWVRFTPNANFNSVVSQGMTFRAWDRTSGPAGQTADASAGGGMTAFSTATETASITVNAVNDVPVAVDHAYSVSQTGSLTVQAPGILADATDADGDTLSVVLVDPPAHAAAFQWQSDGSFTYTPLASFQGTETFTYKASDGTAQSNLATVRISVRPSLGTIDFLRLSNQQPQAGELWHWFTAARDGILTAELTNEQIGLPPGGNAQLTLYSYNPDLDSLQQLLSGPTRLDYGAAVGGQHYALKVGGLTASADLVLANVAQVSTDGKQVTIHGTAAADSLEGLAGAPFMAAINGLYYEFRGATNVTFSGNGGADSLTLTGSGGRDVATVYPDHGTLAGTGYQVQWSAVMSATVHGGGGQDEALLYDSPGNDNLVGTPAYMNLYGSGFSTRAYGFPSVYAYATAGGFDVAKLFDSAGNDTFVAKPDYAGLSGSGFFNRALSFDAVHAYATAGGTDVAKLYDSPGDDTFYADPQQAALYRRGLYYNRAKFFEAVHAFSTAGGRDVADLYDSAGDDTFYADAEQGAMYRAGTYYNRAKYFKEVRAHATAGPSGGNDKAFLYDAPSSADRLDASANRAELKNTVVDFLFTVEDFDYVKARATSAADTKVVSTPLQFELVLEGPWQG